MSEFTEVLEQIERERGIPREKMIANLEEALVSAYRKNFGSSHNVRVSVDKDDGHITVFSTQIVVEEKEPKPGFEISVKDAKKINRKSKPGDKVEVEMPLGEFGRIAAQVAKQVIMQRMREEERDAIYHDFKPKEKTLITGEIRHKDYRDNFLVDMGKVEAIFPIREQIKGESYRPGDRFKFYVVEVKKTSRGPAITLSRTHPELLRRLLEFEVPEIHEGIVEIKGIVRDPGVRAKIAIFSTDEKVDPLGACVGMKGIRIQAIAKELGNEKIDLIRWSNETETYILNALSPAKAQEIHLDKKSKRATILLEDEQLKLAIGKQGQNVRLASRLTGWQIDLRKKEEIVSNLTTLAGVGESTAKALMDAGFRRIEDIVQATVEQLTAAKGIGEKKAKDLLEAARTSLEISKIK